MDAKLYIAIPVHNRFAIAEECIPTVRAGMEKGDRLVIHIDGGSRETPSAVMRSADEYHRQIYNIGIERQRRVHFMDFARCAAYTHLYLTDADALHDPGWRSELLRIQEKYGGAPVCGYNTQAHARLVGNTIEESPEVIWRRVAPGISYLLTREHVEKVVRWLEANPTAEHWNWDWTVPALLGHRFAVARTSCVDHIGYGGYHHPPEEGWDGGDRALNPTPWLVEKRSQVVGLLAGNVGREPRPSP